MRSTSARILAGTAFAAGLISLSPAVWAKDEPPVAIEAGFNAADMGGKVFRLTSPEALKGLTRVVVPLFSVEFVTADQMSAETSGFAAAGRASATAYYKLTGVGEADFAALTQALYADFLRDLAASGLEVVSAEQLAAAPAYRKLLAVASASPIKHDSAITVAPAGLSIYGLNKAAAGGGGKSLFGSLSAFSGAVSAMSAAADTMELQKELNAAVVEVQLRLHFVQLTNHNKGFLGRLSSTASVGANVLPSVSSAMMSVQTASARGVLALQNPLTFDASAFAEVRKAPTTAAGVAGGVAAALINLASGSKNTSSSDEMEAVADPVQYRAVVGSGLGSVREMMLARLKSER